MAGLIISYLNPDYTLGLNSDKLMKRKTTIKVRGHLDHQWEDWFEGIKITHEKGNSILTGSIEDDSCLHGILNKIRDLNLGIISVLISEKKQS